MKQKVVVIFGPTGVGKTNLSLLAAFNRGEIISVDSMQVYKYMDIGTAKPTPEELSKVPHHLISIITPDIQFNAGDFKRKAEKIIKDIAGKGKVPFLVGGTGLYYKALINGIIDIPAISAEVKNELKFDLLRLGQLKMYKKLSDVDPEYSAKIHENDSQRTLRALEVFYYTNKKISDWHKETKPNTDYEFIKIALDMDRSLLYDRINERVDQMLDSGLIEEVKGILDMGYKKNAPGLKAIGYQELVAYFEGCITLDKAIYEIKKNSRRYAKRQFTWFRYVDGVKWFNPLNKVEILNCIEDKLK